MKLCPLGLPASNYFESSEKVYIQLRVGNQNYDATVTDGRDNSSSVEHIEVTLASDGEEEYLRMRVLHETGEVSGLGTVTKSGTQKTGLTIRVEREMVSQDDVLRRESNQLTQAIVRKLGKAYPSNTLLLRGQSRMAGCSPARVFGRCGPHGRWSPAVRHPARPVVWPDQRRSGTSALIWP